MDERHELYVKQLCVLYMIPCDVQNSPRILNELQQFYVQRKSLDEKFVKEITKYQKQYEDIWSGITQVTPDIAIRELALGYTKYWQIMEKLEKIQILQREMNHQSLHWVSTICLASGEVMFSNVDEFDHWQENNLASLREIQESHVRTLEKVWQLQEKLAEYVLRAALRMPCLLQKYTKYFQLSTTGSRIVTNTETTVDGNGNVVLLALFGVDDAVTIERQVCSFCLMDFQQEDTLVRNAAKREATKICTHIFHEEFIAQWMQRSATCSPNCPCCRRPFLINSLHGKVIHNLQSTVTNNNGTLFSPNQLT